MNWQHDFGFLKLPDRQKLIIGHTGWGSKYPQNTLLSFRQASMYANALECDIRLSNDNVWVLSHDHTLSIFTDGVGYVYEKDWSYLQSLDAGATQFSGAYSNRKDTKLPSLEQLFQNFFAKNIMIVLDCKRWSWCPDPSIDISTEFNNLKTLINNYNMSDKIIYHAPEDICNQLKTLDNNITTHPYYYGTEYENSNYQNALDNASGYGHEAIYWYRGYLTQEMIDGIKANGIGMGVTTLSSIGQGHYDMNIDYFVVDDPKVSKVVVNDNISLPTYLK